MGVFDTTVPLSSSPANLAMNDFIDMVSKFKDKFDDMASSADKFSKTMGGAGTEAEKYFKGMNEKLEQEKKDRLGWGSVAVDSISGISNSISSYNNKFNYGRGYSGVGGMVGSMGSGAMGRVEGMEQVVRSVLSPIGSIIGGLVGGIPGAIAGGTIADSLGRWSRYTPVVGDMMKREATVEAAADSIVGHTASRFTEGIDSFDKYKKPLHLARVATGIDFTKGGFSGTGLGPEEAAAIVAGGAKGSGFWGVNLSGSEGRLSRLSLTGFGSLEEVSAAEAQGKRLGTGGLYEKWGKMSGRSVGEVSGAIGSISGNINYGQAFTQMFNVGANGAAVNSMGFAGVMQTTAAMGQGAAAAVGANDASEAMGFRMYVEANPDATYQDYIYSKSSKFMDEKGRKYLAKVMKMGLGGGQMEKVLASKMTGGVISPYGFDTKGATVESLSNMYERKTDGSTDKGQNFEGDDSFDKDAKSVSGIKTNIMVGSIAGLSKFLERANLSGAELVRNMTIMASTSGQVVDGLVEMAKAVKTRKEVEAYIQRGSKSAMEEFIDEAKIKLSGLSPAELTRVWKEILK